jgi:hypothetical protein
LPHVFTQERVAMLSSVLRSRRAVQVNISILRAFVRLRETLALHKDLVHKLTDLERKIEGHDASIRNLFDAIRQLMTPPEKPRRETGFHRTQRAVPGKKKVAMHDSTNDSETNDPARVGGLGFALAGEHQRGKCIEHFEEWLADKWGSETTANERR